MRHSGCSLNVIAVAVAARVGGQDWRAERRKGLEMKKAIVKAMCHCGHSDIDHGEESRRCCRCECQGFDLLFRLPLWPSLPLPLELVDFPAEDYVEDFQDGSDL